jgi:hypothetical protein
MLQDAPTKRYWTNKFRKWLETVTLPCVDRLEVDAHLGSWKTYNKQVITVETELARRTENSKEVAKNAAWRKGCKSCGHAAFGNDCLAHIALGQAVSIPV